MNVVFKANARCYFQDAHVIHNLYCATLHHGDMYARHGVARINHKSLVLAFLGLDIDHADFEFRES